MTQFWIEDRGNPGKREWVLNRSEQLQTGVYKDYAIVARMVDPNTDQYVVVAAGIGRGGTVAAGPVATNPRTTARRPTRPVNGSVGSMGRRMPVAIQEHFV